MLFFEMNDDCPRLAVIIFGDGANGVEIAADRRRYDDRPASGGNTP